jgi:hypothetical protein
LVTQADAERGAQSVRSHPTTADVAMESSEEEEEVQHKAYLGAIVSPTPAMATLARGVEVAVYFEDLDEWSSGHIEQMSAGCDSVILFEDGVRETLELASTSYGRFNLWVLPDPTRSEVWSDNGHRLIGRQCEHAGQAGTLRMWCAATSMFSMAVRGPGLPPGIEQEVLVTQADAERGAQSVRAHRMPTAPSLSFAARAARAGTNMQVPPLLVPGYGRPQDGLQSLRDLYDLVGRLRHQIISASPRRGVHDVDQTCVISDICGLIGIGKKGWYVLRKAMRHGRLPSKILSADRAWVDPIVYAQRLHALCFWVAHGTTEIDDLRGKLHAHLAVEQATPPTAPTDHSASSLQQLATPLTLNWSGEKDELKRAIMVRSLTQI